MTGRFFLRAVKALVRVTLFDSFRIRPRTEVSSLLIVQSAAKIQSPEPRLDNIGYCSSWDSRQGAALEHAHDGVCATKLGLCPNIYSCIVMFAIKVRNHTCSAQAKTRNGLIGYLSELVHPSSLNINL